MSSSLRIGFLIDPLESLNFGHDTSFALMAEASRRGHEVWTFEQRDLAFVKNRVQARMRSIHIPEDWKDLDAQRQAAEDASGTSVDGASGNTGFPFEFLSSEDRPLADLDVLFMRKDPPVDEDFVQATLMVDLAGETGPFVVNSPAGLRTANEKLFALRFPELGPPTEVLRTEAQIRDFMLRHGNQAIVKPVDGFAGRGVVKLSKDDPNLSSVVELLTRGGELSVIVQAVLPVEKAGDKRILLLGGKPIGGLLRLPKAGEIRANMAAGGSVEKTELTPREQEICETLAPSLMKHGLHFVGIDVIGDMLTEVNVTSPTGLVEIEELDKAPIAGMVIDYVQKEVEARRD